MFNWKFGSKPAEPDDKNATNQEAQASSVRGLPGVYDGNVGIGPGNMSQRGMRNSQS